MLQGVSQETSVNERDRVGWTRKQRDRPWKRWKSRCRQRLRRRPEEAQSSSVRRRRLRQGVHEKLPPKGPQENSHG